MGGRRSRYVFLIFSDRGSCERSVRVENIRLG
jgi:hypothetical protein